jgi:hypothetical protein
MIGNLPHPPFHRGCVLTRCSSGFFNVIILYNIILIFSYVMDKLYLIGQNLGRVFNSIYVRCLNIPCSTCVVAKQPSLKLKTRPKKTTFRFSPVSFYAPWLSGLGEAWWYVDPQQSVKYCRQLPSRLCGQHRQLLLLRTDW